MLSLDICTKRLSHIRDKCSTPVRIKPPQRLCYRKRGKVARDELVRQWQFRSLYHSTHACVSEASRDHEVVQLLGVVQSKGRSRHRAGFGTHVSCHRLGEGGRIGVIPDRTPYCEGEPTAQAQNSTHLA